MGRFEGTIDGRTRCVTRDALRVTGNFQGSTVQRSTPIRDGPTSFGVEEVRNKWAKRGD